MTEPRMYVKQGEVELARDMSSNAFAVTFENGVCFDSLTRTLPRQAAGEGAYPLLEYREALSICFPSSQIVRLA